MVLGLNVPARYSVPPPGYPGGGQLCQSPGYRPMLNPPPNNFLQRGPRYFNLGVNSVFALIKNLSFSSYVVTRYLYCVAVY